MLISTVFCSCLLGTAQGGAQPPNDWEPRVRALVRQLGDPSYAKREAATKALLAEGDKIVPLIDQARDRADLELARRIDRIRSQLIGYIIDLTDFLKTLPQTDKEPLPPIPKEIVALVAANQPRTGDFLLRIIADPSHALHRPATHLFCAAWHTGPPVHLRRYLQSSFRLQAFHRSRYPHGIDAYIETRYWQHHGWIGWPQDLKWQTRTAHFIDGQAHGKPFVYNYPGGGATTGWINAGKVPLGKHTLRFEVEFEFTHKDEKHRGNVRSPEFTFSIVAPEPNDDLVAPTTAALDKIVRQGLRITEHHGPDENAPQIGGFRIDWWQPQVTWEEPKGKRRGLHVPEWWVKEPLPVDLCFDVEIRDVQTAKRYPGDALVLKKGETSRGYFTPRDARAFCKDKDGFVEVEIDLQPSRSVALTNPQITGYFGWPIASKKLRAKVFGEIKDVERK